MKLVYLAGPITKGPTDGNVAQADVAMFRLMSSGVAVINPMLSCWAGAGIERVRVRCRRQSGVPHPDPKAHGHFQTISHTGWLDMDKEIVGRCDAVLRLPGESSGADIETAHAAECGVPVFHDIEELIRWATV